MKRTRNAFTLIEMLIVIAIISVLAAMAIASFANAAQDSREVVVRQQLASVQEAVNNWASRQIGKVEWDSSTPKQPLPPKSLATIRATYNAANTTTSRFALFSSYLDAGTIESATATNSPARVTTDAMLQTGKYLTLPDWGAGSFPKIQLNP